MSPRKNPAAVELSYSVRVTRPNGAIVGVAAFRTLQGAQHCADRWVAMGRGVQIVAEPRPRATEDQS